MRRIVIKALALSFAVYFVPLVGRHGIIPWGVALWQEVVEWRGPREPLWRLTDVGFAFAAQLGMFALLLIILWRPGLIRRLAAILAFVPATMAINWVYQIEIPKYFLIEPETARETGRWPVQCERADVSLVQLRSGIGVAHERFGEAWVMTVDATRMAPIGLPNCDFAAEPIMLGPDGSAIDSVGPGGAVLYRTYRRGDGSFEHHFRRPGGAPPLRVEPPSDVPNWAPLISEDGQAIAWLDRRRGVDARRMHVLLVRRFDGQADREIDIDQPANAQLRLLSYDAVSRVAVLSRYPDEVLSIDDAGKVIWGPTSVGGIALLGIGFRRIAGGWVAWDTYREEGRYRVRWSLQAGAGMHEVPKGRSIHAVAVDPKGRFIAISVGGHLTIGEVKDSVYVLKASDGSEIFRRFLPPYSRSHLAFLGADALAMSVIENGRSVVRVLHAPE